MPAAPNASQNLFRPDQVAPSPTAAEPTASAPAATPDTASAQPTTAPESDVITWTASEFIAHQKSATWYSLSVLTAVGLGAIIYLLTRDFFPTTVVPFGVILLAIYAGRQPRQETYRLDHVGLTIGNRHYGFHEFRSFTVVPEGAFSSIELTPLGRFAMYANLYFDPADEDRIVARLSQYLPLEEPRHSFVDGLMRRIHF